jgi:endonuclease/exonuclease/phosphatase family metal-dependent hydrolase
VLVLLLGGAAALAPPPASRLRRWGSFFRTERQVKVVNAPDAPLWSEAEPLKVLSWNVQYAADIRQHFFYDGGMAVSAPRTDVELTLRNLAQTIRDVDPDVVLLQEVDRGSRRTCHIDQHARLLAATGYGCHTSAAYWRVPYVPHPKHEHVGKVNMHLSTFSRFQLGGATRVQLPLLDESRVRRLFNLKRAILDVSLQTAGGGQ